MNFFLKYFLIWLPMIVIAIANGAARDLWYKKAIGELAGRQLSTVSLLVLFGIYIWFMLKKFTPTSVNQSLYIGALWLLLTLVFEFGIGLAGGKSWSEMLADYNIFRGRIWVLVPVFVGFAPRLFMWMNSGE